MKTLELMPDAVDDVHKENGKTYFCWNFKLKNAAQKMVVDSYSSKNTAS